MKRFLTVLCFFPLAAQADIEGLTLRLDKTDRDEPIESWIVFENEAGVHYYRCLASAAECTRESKEGDIAQKRTVTKALWLSEVARTYGLDARILLNETASAKRIDAAIEALRALESDERATTDERAKAKLKLEQLTKKDGYRDRFHQARALAKALPKPTGDESNLVLEASDKRSYRTLWPFNFDEKAVESTETALKAADVVTGLRWSALKAKKASWLDAGTVCKDADAGVVPSAEQARAAAPWLLALFGKTLAAEGSPGGSARFWLPAGNVKRVDPVFRNGVEPPATATGVGKVYHYYEGLFDYFQLDAKSASGGSVVTLVPAEKGYPTITQKLPTIGLIKPYDEVTEPKTEDVLVKVGAKTPEYGVLCVRPRVVK